MRKFLVALFVFASLISFGQGPSGSKGIASTIQINPTDYVGWTTANRPPGVSSRYGWNLDSLKFEYFASGSWHTVGAPTGTSSAGDLNTVLGNGAVGFNKNMILRDVLGNDVFNVNPVAHQIAIGDVGLAANKTLLQIDDGSGTLQMIGPNGLQLILGSFSTADRILLHNQEQSSGTNNIYMPTYFTGIDTLATQRDVRLGVHGLDDVLSLNQQITTSRQVQLPSNFNAGLEFAGHGLAPFIISNDGGGTALTIRELSGNGLGINSTVTFGLAGWFINSAAGGGALEADGGLGTGLQASTTGTTPTIITFAGPSPNYVGISTYTTTSNVEQIANFQRRTSGTGTNGIGGSIDVLLQENVASSDIASRMVTRWLDATPLTRTSQWELDLINNGTQQAVFFMEPNGEVTFPASASFGVFANNAAAIAGGKPVGRVYRNTLGGLSIVF